jgi:DNA-binding transcriptional ArsR family regulator
MATDTGVFRALADPTRRQILQDLREGELAAGDIAGRFSISAPSISRHLTVLKSAGLVVERREGNRILYSLVGDRLAASVGDFLSSVCPDQMILRKRRAGKGKGAK